MKIDKELRELINKFSKLKPEQKKYIHNWMDDKIQGYKDMNNKTV